MFRKAVAAKPCAELLKEFEGTKLALHGEKLCFSGVDGRDVYNITAPFEDDGELVIAGRVEARDSEIAEIMFFVCREGVWVPRENTRVFRRIQDPFYTRIHGELIFGGVEIDTDPADDERIVCWRTLFFRGRNIDHLEFFAAGPDRMKDIRLVELANGNIGVFTRPQGEIGGMGKIGYIEIASLDGLNADVIEKARILDTHFIPQEWGGSNEPHLLKNGLVGVLGHIACLDGEMGKHYHAMTFAFDPVARETSPVKMIAVRGIFPEGAYKRKDLVDVLFSGGIKRLGNGTAVLYAGISDAEAHRIVIPDPFEEYEGWGGYTAGPGGLG